MKQKQTPNKNRIKHFVLVSFILMQIFLLFFNRFDTLNIESVPNTIPSPNIFLDNIVGQTFVSPQNNLNRIDIMFGTHGRTNDQTVAFEIWEVHPKRQMEARVNFYASKVLNNLFTSIRFKPIKKSKNKKYEYTLSSPDSTPDNSICIWMNTENIYEDGTFVFRNVVSQGDLVFRTYSRRPIFTELDRIVQNYTGIFRSQVLLILAILFFEIILLLVLFKLLDFFQNSLKNFPEKPKGETNV